MADTNSDNPIVPQGVTLREFDDTRAARKAIYEGTIDALKKRFPLENRSYRLELSNIRYTGPQDFTLAQQKQALLTDRNLHTPVSGRFRLIRKSDNAVVDERDEVIMNVPYYTDRGTIINNGSEYTVANQLRLRPGVYTRVRRSGDVETQFNVKPGTGRGFRLRMEPSTGVVSVNVGHANMPLYPILRSLGVTDREIIKAWGADVAHANAVKAESAAGRSAVDKLYQAFAGYNATAQDLVSKERYLAETLPKFELDPGVTARTLGLNANGVTPEVLLRASAKMFGVNRGDEKPDDRDNPGFANVYGIEDLYRERIEKDAGRLSRSIMAKISRAGSLKPVGRAAFSGWHDELLHGSGLAMPGDNSNIMALEEQLMRVTRLGEGGIGSVDLLTDEARQVNPGNLNYIDFISGPEDGKIGADARVGVNARKGSDGRLYSLFINRSGRREYVPADVASDSVIGFPNPEKGAKYVPAMKRGRVQSVPRDEVDYWVPGISGMFSSNINLNPMPTAVQGGRQFYGSKFWGQYMPTEHGEVPLVESLMPDGKTTWGEHYGRKLGTLKAGVDGTVTKVTDGGVTVTDGEGKKHFVETVRDFPFNGLTGITYEPTVKVGDTVKADDMVAASNFVDRKTGGLAMGHNMRVAWIPARGDSVSGDTSVLWRRPDGSFTFGPISNVEVGPGMGSIAVDPHTGEQHIIDATAWMIHRPDSKMYCVTMSNGATVKVTGSHGMMKYDGHHGLTKCRADSLVPGKDVVAFIRPELPFNTGPDNVLCTSEHNRGASRAFPLDRDFGWLVGIFLSEGCVVYRNNIPHSVSIACTEQDIIDKIAEIAARFEITCTYRKSEYERVESGKQVTSGKSLLSSASLASWLAAHTGRYAWGKYLPDIVWTGPREFAYGLIDGYICGDGCITDKQCTISTSSPVMADGLCLLLGAIGVRANNRRYRFYTNPKQKRAIHMVYMYRETVQNLPRISLRRKDNAVAALREFYESSKKFKIGDIIPVPTNAPYMFSSGRPTVSRDKARSRLAKYRSAGCHTARSIQFIEDATALVDGPLMWSRVQSVTEVPSEEYVYDIEMAPYGTFIAGYGLVVHNSHEDAVVLSESAAKKLATSRLYGFEMDTDGGVQIGLNRYMSAFPKRFTKEQFATLDENGVVKEGTVLSKGDPISVAVGPKLLTAEDANLGKLSKVLRGAFTDRAQVWDHDYPGTVVSSAVFRGRAKVNVKAAPPVAVADKLAPRYALKGVVSKVVPDDMMPRDAATNEPFDILMNPMGIPSRVAPGQLIETSLGKLAKATGRQIRIPQDAPEEGWAAWTKAQLDAAGVPTTTDVYDPETGRTLHGIGDGYVYWHAMHHIADKKISAKGGSGAYTADLQPAKGGSRGAKRNSWLDAVALLSHGATEVLKDVQVTRGEKNDEYWRAVRSGGPLPMPKVPFVYQKVLNLLRAGGINVVEGQNAVSIMPMTDRDTDMLAGDRVISNSKTLDFDLKEEKGGLFDPVATGGSGNRDRWAAIRLPEPVPNPVMEEPVRRVLGLTGKRLQAVISGEERLDGKTGGEALVAALGKIDVDAEIARQREIVRTARGSARDDAVKIIGYLDGCRKQGVTPKDWMITKVPVIPPMFRPVAKAGDTMLVSDLNELYRDVIESADAMKSLRSEVGDAGVTEERLNLYKAVKAAYGLGSPISPEGQAKGLKGAIRQVIGSTPKFGLYQSKVLSKPVDGVGRAVITPEPNFDMDHCGITEDSAWTLYRDYVVRALRRRGYPEERALQLIDDKAQVAKDLLVEEMGRRPVILDRAPTWHKFNYMAFWPVLVDGSTMRMNPLVLPGFNADFDGDNQIGQVFVTFSDLNGTVYAKNKAYCKSIANLLYFCRHMTKENSNDK